MPQVFLGLLGLGENMSSLAAGISRSDFSIGTLISSTFGVLHRAFGKFIALAIIPVIPTVLGLFLIAEPAPGTPPNLGLIWVPALLSTILLFMIQGATIYGATNEMRGRGFSVGEALSKGLARFLPLLGVSLLVGLMTGIGIILLIVPGLIVLCIFYAAAVVCVVEQKGVFASLSRSAELTKGYRWKILGLLLIVGVVSAVVGAIVGGIGTALAGHLVGNLLAQVIQIYVGAYGSVLIALAYYTLRSIKEGIDIDRIADVFD